MVDELVQRLGEVYFGEEQPDAMQEHARDRLVIAFAVAVYAADTLVVAANDAGELGIDIDVRAARQEPGRRREVCFVSPFGSRQGAREEPSTDMFDLGVRLERSGSVFGHLIGSC